MYKKVKRIRLDLINNNVALSLSDVETIFTPEVLDTLCLENIEIQGDVDPCIVDDCYQICAYFLFFDVPVTLVSSGGVIKDKYNKLFNNTSSILFPRWIGDSHDPIEVGKTLGTWSRQLGKPGVFSFESLKKLSQTPVYQPPKFVQPCTPLCKARIKQSIYIDNVGQVFPCYWLGSALNNPSPHIDTPIAYDRKSCNALMMPLLDILNNQFFIQHMQDMLRNFPSTICETQCGR